MNNAPEQSLTEPGTGTLAHFGVRKSLKFFVCKPDLLLPQLIPRNFCGAGTEGWCLTKTLEVQPESKLLVATADVHICWDTYMNIELLTKYCGTQVGMGTCVFAVFFKAFQSILKALRPFKALQKCKGPVPTITLYKKITADLRLLKKKLTAYRMKFSVPHPPLFIAVNDGTF